MGEQIIAALLTRNDAGQVTNITFQGRWYVIAPTDHDYYLPHRFPRRGEDPTRVICPRECPAYAETRYDTRLHMVTDELPPIPLPVLHTAVEWATQRGFRIVDPDGWRTPGSPSLDELISEDEFLARVAVSTIGPLPGERYE